MKKISIIVIIVIVVLVGCLLLNSNIIKPNIAKLDISSPENIVTKIEAEVYSTSTPVDTYATIRWGEQGTYRNKDVSAMGVYLNGTDQKLLNFFDVTKVTLERNGFSKDLANSFGDIVTDTREDAGYINGNTICKVSIGVNERIKKYYLSLKCGIFGGVF